eukprot:scaffold220733_cov17-Prasinocladus_malaysianus.AAC.1
MCCVGFPSWKSASGQGKSAFYPFSVLLNAVLSMTVMWQNYGEKAIRDSKGLEYAIVRPPALTDAPDGRSDATCLHNHP